MNKTQPPNIKYIGKIPVRISGTPGEIHPHQTLYLPQKLVNNLLQDKENWTPDETPQLKDDTPSSEEIPPEEEFPHSEEPPVEEKKKKKKEAK